jgi:hypothetical protein
MPNRGNENRRSLKLGIPTAALSHYLLDLMVRDLTRIDNYFADPDQLPQRIAWMDLITLDWNFNNKPYLVFRTQIQRNRSFVLLDDRFDDRQA